MTVQNPLTNGKEHITSFGAPAVNLYEKHKRAGWETMLEMETMDLNGGQNSAGATTLVVDLAKACEKKVQLNVVWIWAIYFDSPLRVLRVLNVVL